MRRVGMGIPHTGMRLRHRSPWRDPARVVTTLESFAATEEDGGGDLARAVRRVRDPELRAHLERHARDEVRHAALFRARAAELAGAARDEARPDEPHDLSRAWAGEGRMRGTGSIAEGFRTAWELLRGPWNGPYGYLVPLVVLSLPAAILFVFLRAVPYVAPLVHSMS